MSRRRVQSEQGQWSGAGDAGGSTRRQGLRSRPQQQTQGGKAAAQSGKARGSKRPRPAPPAVADGSPGNGRKRLKVPEAAASGSAGREQVVERRSERLKHCLRVGYRNLDRFGTKEPFWEEILNDNATPPGGGLVGKQQVQVQEKQDPVLKSWGKRKRRWSRVKENVNTGEHEPEPEVWLHVDVLEVQGSREINSWIQKNRKEKLNGGQGTDASADEVESSSEEDAAKSADQPRRRARLLQAPRKRPRIEKRLADLGIGSSAAIGKCASEVAVEDSASDQDVADEDCGLKNARSPSVTTGKDAVGLLEGGVDDNDEEKVVRSSVDESSENNVLAPETSKILSGDDHGGLVEHVSSSSDDMPEVFDSSLRPAEGEDALRCPIRLGSPARVSADAVLDLDKVQALSCLVDAGKHETESSRGTNNPLSVGAQELNAVRRARTDDGSVSQENVDDREEGGSLVPASEDDLQKDDVSNNGVMVVEFPSGNCNDDVLREARPHGDCGTVRKDEAGLSRGTVTTPESRSEKLTLTTNGVAGQTLQVLQISSPVGEEIHRGCGRESVLDHTHDVEEHLSSGTKDGSAVVEDQLLTYTDVSVPQEGNSQEKFQLVISQAEAEKFHVQNMASLPTIDSYSQEICSETHQRCLGGWIEEERIDIVTEDLHSLECTEKLNGEENLSLVQGAQGSRPNEAETGEVRDGGETIRAQTGWMLAGGKPSSDVGLARAPEKTETENCEPHSGECLLLSLQGQAKFGGSEGVDICSPAVPNAELQVVVTAVKTSRSFGDELGISTDIEFPARVEGSQPVDDVRIEAESEEHELSELQKSLLESFHSFQDPGDGVFVSQDFQPGYSEQLRNEAQRGAGSIGDTTSLIKHTDYLAKTAVDSSIELPVLQSNTHLGQDIQDAGVCGYRKDNSSSSSDTREGTAYADEPAGEIIAVETNACTEQVTGFDERFVVGSTDAMVEDTVGFVPLIKRDGDRLEKEVREPQEEKAEGHNVKCIIVDIGMEEVVGGEREGSVVVPLGQGDLCAGHTVDEGRVLDLQLVTHRSSVDTATKHSARSEQDIRTPVSDLGSQPLLSGSVSKLRMPMESVYSSTLIALSKQFNQMPIVYNDVEGSALQKQYQVLGLEPDDSVKVYCRRKRGRDLHLFGMEGMEQHLGGDGDADEQSDPVYSEAVIIFNNSASPQEKCSSHGAIDGKPGLDGTRSPVNSQTAVASKLVDQGGLPQQDPFLKCPVSGKGQALSDYLRDRTEASATSTEVSPGSSDESPSINVCVSLQMRNFTSEVAHKELDNSCSYPKGLNAARDVSTSQGVCEETVLSKEEINQCDGDGKTEIQEDVACSLQSREETGQGFTSTHATTDLGEPIMVAVSGGRLLNHDRRVALPAHTSRVTGPPGEAGLKLSDALPLDMSSGEPEGRSFIGYVQSDGMNEVIGHEHRLNVQEAVQACTVEERTEISPSRGQSVQNRVAGDELIVGSAVRMHLHPEQIMLPDPVKKGAVYELEASSLKDLANLEPLASEGQERDTMQVQKAEEMREPLVPVSCEAGATHLSDGSRKDGGDVCLKTGVEKGSEQSADTDLNLSSDLHAAYLRSLKCGLCGGSNDGRPPKDMRTGDGKFLRGKSVLDKGEGFEDSEGWLGQLVGPLTSRTGVQGVWVHRQCAIWSPEVYFSGVGRMKNVKAALRRGRYLKCSSCNQPGATIGCCMERCPRTYHLPCARLEGCVFDHVKYLMTCIDHMHLLHPRGQKKSGNANAQTGLCEFEDGTDFHVGGFTKMVRERRIAAACARLKDLEAEEKWVENTAEDEEFLRRERKRLQRDLARMVPVQVGGQAMNDDGTSLSEGWESVAGLEDVIQSLKEVVTLPLLYPDVYSRLGVCPPRGVLLHGYPGTGKTHVVRAMVGACARGGQQVAYFARKGADCLGKYVGDSERQLRLLFQIAEECQPSIIFFDEMDGLAPSRSGQNDQTHSSVVSTLLALMDGLNSRGSVVVIGATNRADALDPALRRPGRFDREILFPLPLLREREAILALHTRKWVPCPSLRLLSAVARVTSGFAGADLQALCVEAAMTALRRACPISKLVECAEKAHSLTDIPPLPLVQVRGADWAAALRHVSPPCSKRKTLTACGSARAAPLPKHMGRILLPYLLEVLVSLHLDSRVSLPPGLRKLVMLVRHSIMSYAGYDTSGINFPSNWLVLLREWPFEANASQALAEALVETGITCSGDKFEASTVQVSVHSSESDCDSSGKGAGIESSVEMDQTGRHGLDSALPPDMPLHQRSLVHKNSLQGRSNVMIAGAPKSGQSLIAAALLHGFESFGQVRVLSLPTMLQEGNGSVTEGLLSILGEAERTSPCIVFMPNFEHWALERVPNEDLEEPGVPSPLQEAEIDGFTAERQTAAGEMIKQSNMKSSMVASGSWKVLMQFMQSCNKAPILILGTSELHLEQHPSCVLRFFSGYKRSHSNLCSFQTVPSAIVEVPLITGSVPEIFESASENIAKALAVDFVRNLCRLVVQLNRAESIPTCGGSDSSVEKFVREQVAAGSSTEPVANENTVCEDQDLQIEVGDDQEAKNKSVDVMPVSAQQAGSEDFVQEAQLAAQDSGNKLQPKGRQGHPCEGMSTNQKSLISAIVYCGFQLLHDPQFRELRQATARLKVGPQVNIKDSSGLDSSNVNEYCQQFSRQDVCARSSGGSNSSEETKEIWVRGIVAVGLIAYRGLYSTATEVAWEVRKVIELLHQRISKRVESGANRWDYFPITSQAAALEDMMGSWRHEVVRLEEAAVQPSLGAVNLAPTTERPSHSACGSGAVPKHPVPEEHGLPAVGLVPGCSNSGTEKAPSVVGPDQSQDLGLSTHVSAQKDAENFIQVTTAGDDKEAIQAGQEAQRCSSNNRLGQRDKDVDFSHGALLQKDTLVDLTSDSTDVQGTPPAAYPVQRSTIVAKFTKACLEKLQVTVKDVLVDAWQQNGSTTSADMLNDLITGSAASAMTASRGSVKVYEEQPALLQDVCRLDCGSAVCWEQVNCLCTKRPMPCDLEIEGARSNQPVNSLLAEGTGETGSKAWKDRDSAVCRTRSRAVMREPATGLCKGSPVTVQDGEGCICLCPVVMALKKHMALRKQKSKIRIQ